MREQYRFQNAPQLRAPDSSGVLQAQARLAQGLYGQQQFLETRDVNTSKAIESARRYAAEAKHQAERDKANDAYRIQTAKDTAAFRKQSQLNDAEKARLTAKNRATILTNADTERNRQIQLEKDRREAILNPIIAKDSYKGEDKTFTTTGFVVPEGKDAVLGNEYLGNVQAIKDQQFLASDGKVKKIGGVPTAEFVLNADGSKTLVPLDPRIFEANVQAKLLKSKNFGYHPYNYIRDGLENNAIRFGKVANEIGSNEVGYDYLTDKLKQRKSQETQVDPAVLKKILGEYQTLNTDTNDMLKSYDESFLRSKQGPLSLKVPGKETKYTIPEKIANIKKRYKAIKNPTVAQQLAFGGTLSVLQNERKSNTDSTRRVKDSTQIALNKAKITYKYGIEQAQLKAFAAQEKSRAKINAKAQTLAVSLHKKFPDTPIKVFKAQMMSGLTR